MMVLLGVGTTGSVLVHAALQCYGAYRAGVPLRPRRGWRADPEARDALRRIVRSIPVAACPAVANYGLTVVAATVPGGVLIVQLSYQVFYGLSFVGARAVSMAALPGLAEAVSAGDQRRFGTAWRQGVFYMLIAAVPLLCLLAVFAGPTADILANGGLRDGNLIAQLAACLAVVAVAQLVGGLHDYGQQALFARFDDWGPRIASFAGLGATVLVSAASMALPAQDGRLPGLAVAILAGELAGGLTALIRLRRDAPGGHAGPPARAHGRRGHRRDAAGDRAGLVAARRAGAGPGVGAGAARGVRPGRAGAVRAGPAAARVGRYRPLAAPPRDRPARAGPAGRGAARRAVGVPAPPTRLRGGHGAGAAVSGPPGRPGG